MSRTKPYGRAYKISESDAKAYERTSRPRKYTPNPLGVTAMAAVNGKGAYRSARSVAAGKTRAQRQNRARSVMRNGEIDMPKRAGFLKNRRSRSMRRNETEPHWEEVGQAREAAAAKTSAAKRKKAAYKPKASAAQTKAKKSRTGKRLAAYNQALRTAKKKGLSGEAAELKAKRSAIRNVPMKAGDSFKGTAKKHVRPKSAAQKKAARTVGRKPVAPKKKKAAKKASPSQRTYERVYITDPSTGKRKLSWMYKDKGGRLRRVPTEALYFPADHKRAGKARPGGVSKDRVAKRRASAAKTITEKGGTFVPNAKRKSAKSVRSGKRLAAYRKALGSAKSPAAKSKAAAVARRAVPLQGTDTFGGVSAGGAKKTTKRKKTTRKKVAKKTTTRRKATRKKAAKKTTTRRRKVSNHKPLKKAVRKSRRKSIVASTPVKRKRKKTTKKRTGGKMTKAARSAAAKKGARTRKRNAGKTVKRNGYKKNGRKAGYTYSATKHPRVMKRRRKKSYKKNNFMAQLTQVLKTGAFVAGGFLTHKILTSAVCNYVFDKIESTATSATLQTWKKPICGTLVLLAGIPLARVVAKKNSTEVAAGMAASLIQSVIVAALTSAKQDVWAGNLSGYSNSRAYSLRGPVERDATSIMPRYDRLSGFQQAAAGMGAFQQAAAGTGEYFSANATGEFFAPNNLQGVGSYEAAGQLAMQASAGVQDIDDGIRPDSDIDGLMDLAEAAAGLRGMGEFYSAVQAGGGRVVEKRVGTTSQWIPSGPLWAGTDSVEDNQATSELSAGILARSGGNGSLSA